MPLGQYSGSIWHIEQCRNAFLIALKSPLNQLLLFFKEENFVQR